MKSCMSAEWKQLTLIRDSEKSSQTLYIFSSQLGGLRLLVTPCPSCSSVASSVDLRRAKHAEALLLPDL